MAAINEEQKKFQNLTADPSDSSYSKGRWSGPQDEHWIHQIPVWDW